MSVAIFNKAELMSNFEGDEDILIDLITEFENKGFKLLLDIKEGIVAKDADKLKITAHTFKGVVSNFYAEELRQIAYDLEKMGMEKKFEGADEKLEKLNLLLTDLFNELSKLKQSLQ